MYASQAIWIKVNLESDFITLWAAHGLAPIFVGAPFA